MSVNFTTGDRLRSRGANRALHLKGGWRRAALSLRMDYDVIIVGGGPAGLSAATILGRARRRVVVFDDGNYRNEASRGIHGFLSRDGIHPAELRRIAREQLARYDVEYLCNHVTSARAISDGFVVILDDGAELRCRKLLLATGVRDHLPEIEGA